MALPTWRADTFHEVEVLADEEMHAAERMIAIVENFGYGWHANALPPRGDGTSSMLPGFVRGGYFGDRLADAKSWCERICGLHPERVGDRYSEPLP